MSYCQNCANLQAEITRLQTEVAMLLHIIAAARSECATLANEAEQKQAGHVPTGVWAYAQAQKDTAQKVLSCLSL